MPDTLSGPSLAPASGGAARSLVILLHGVGADGDDLIGLAPYFARALPDARFVAPNAPDRCEFSPSGYQWFSIQTPDPAARLAGARRAAALLDRFIDTELARAGLAEDRLALVGFSQGTMMSLFVAPRRARAVAGVLGYSGRLDSPDALAAEARSRPPVVLVHGTEDELLPVRLMAEAARGLEAAGLAVTTHARPGLGHGIDPEGVAIGTAFLAKVLGSQAPERGQSA
ncbi:MAG: phospholipase [Alphaproteobacteria bacterium]|nr:phospholipase [Alphaproteobacteria bacterium]